MRIQKLPPEEIRVRKLFQVLLIANGEKYATGFRTCLQHETRKKEVNPL
jgi:hypothetical protein